ncbi:MAG: MBL fold metallo-hydrolase [Betaproteobacteria bacterium]|nr:MBL fold metallo-hydrolase [Betaproteobacteria bacterium]
MSENSGSITRRDFTKGVAVGTMAGAIGAMGVYSYSPIRKQHFAKAAPPKVNIGEVKSVKVTNISETSWFDNKKLMGDIKGAGGLLVNQYTYNWPPFAQVKGKLGKGSYEEGVKNIKQFLPGKLEDAWAFQMENAVNPLNAGGFSALIEVETLEGEVKRILLDSGWSYDWMDKAFKREGIDKLLAEGKIDYFVISHEHFDHMWAIPVTFKYAPTVRTLYPKGFYPGRSRLHQGRRPSRRTDRDHTRAVQAVPGRRAVQLPDTDHLPRVRRAVAVLQRQGQGPGHGDRLLPPGHPAVRVDRAARR